MQTTNHLSREIFIDNLRDALRNLYNFEFLRTSPLADLLDIQERFDKSRALQKILIESINAFKPPSDEPDQSRSWRIFDSLFCCFVQQLKQQIVADQLCISPRQLRREQRIALESLADYLWDQYKLDSKPHHSSPAPVTFETLDLEKELGWVQDLQPSQPAHLKEELEGVIEVLTPLCRQKVVTIEKDIPSHISPLAIHPVVLTQILVNILNAAVNRATDGKVIIVVQRVGWVVKVDIRVPKDIPSTQLNPVEKSINLSVASKLAELSSIQLEITREDHFYFWAKLYIPIQEQIPVLLVDDNQDALDLFHRYAVGSRYRLVSTRDPNEILGFVSQTDPRLIVLDIMMPETNGWKILGMLKNHPLTVDIPIIICTILPQRELALSLGASDFINKPISREDFLACLNQQNFAGTH